MWRILRIKLKNFKVYEGEYDIPLSQTTVVVGRVGAGKSSLLQAIEFALFGRELEVRQRIAKLADLVNLSSDESVVELSLSDQHEASIRRVLNKRGRTRLEVVIGGRKYYDNSAEVKLREITGISDEDYDRVVYISHYALEDFIHGDRPRRNLLIDRILQVDVLDNVQRALGNQMKNILEKMEQIRLKLSLYEKYRDIIEKYGSISKMKEIRMRLEKELDGLSEQENELSKKYRNLIEEREKYLNKIINIQDKLNQYYMAKSELEILEGAGQADLIGEYSLLEDLKDKFLGVLSEFEHVIGADMIEQIHRESEPARLVDLLSKAYDALEEALKKIEEEVESLKRQKDSVEARLRELERDISRVQGALSQLEASYKRFKELEAAHGSISNIKNIYNEVKSKYTILERNFHFISSIKFILSYINEAGLEECPICGSKLDRRAVVERLRQIEHNFSEQLKELDLLRSRLEELKSVYEEMEALSKSVAEYLRASEELKSLLSEREKLENRKAQIDRALGQIMRRRSLLAGFLNEVRRETLDEAIRRYNRALRVKQLRERVETLERELKNLGVGPTTLETEEEFRRVAEALSRIRRRRNEIVEELRKVDEVLNSVGEDYDGLRERLEKYSYVYDRLNNIINKIDILKYNIRLKIINLLRDELVKSFKELYPYEDIVSIELRSEERGYEIYCKLADGNTVGLARLSDGQRLAVALSLVISMRKLLGLGLGFLLLDDPLPYVDPKIRSSLAKLIAKLSREFQVIVTTQTEELANEISANGVDVSLIKLTRGTTKPEVKIEKI